MTRQEEVQEIIARYENSISVLADNDTAKEFKTVMTYIASEANRRQRQLVGLED